MRKSQWGNRRDDVTATMETAQNNARMKPDVKQKVLRDPTAHDEENKGVVGATLATKENGPTKKTLGKDKRLIKTDGNVSAQSGPLSFESDVLQDRYGGMKNRTRALALLQNSAVPYAMEMMKSESARVDAKLLTDFDQVLAGQCVYMPSFACDSKDFSLYEQMQAELLAYVRAQEKKNEETKGGDEDDAATVVISDVNKNVTDSEKEQQATKKVDLTPKTEVESLRIAWSKHQIFENPESISPTFNILIAALAEYFSVEVYATRLNYYRDGSHYKPFHHDSHAYGGRALREDFTMGISLGATRGLAFLHEPSGRVFDFPQQNGDMFAFTNEVNQRFQHGVPKATCGLVGERLSVIAWGRRKEINMRNGGSLYERSNKNSNNGQGTTTHVDRPMAGVSEGNRMVSVDDAVSAAQDLVSMRRPTNSTAMSEGMSREISSASSATTATRSTTSSAAAKKKKKNRLQ